MPKNIFFKIKIKGRKTPKKYKIENIPDNLVSNYKKDLKKKGAYDIGEVKVR